MLKISKFSVHFKCARAYMRIGRYAPDLVLSLLSLKCPFRPMLCPFRPSNTRLKFAETVLFYFISAEISNCG